MKKLMFLVLVMAVLAGPALAGPTGQYRLAFITSTNDSVHFGDWDLSTSLADADAYMQALATAAGLPGTDWKILGSASYVDARDHTGTNPLTDGVGVPIYLVDGTTLVATGNDDLWDGSPTGIISQDENGNAKTHWPLTGTMPDGTKAMGINSGGWGLDATTTEIQQGNGTSTTQMFYRQWTSRPADPASGRYQSLPTYAISEIIPEPATMALLGLGGLTLLRRRRNG